jgi:hypothetical protein
MLVVATAAVSVSMAGCAEFLWAALIDTTADVPDYSVYRFHSIRLGMSQQGAR